MDKNQKDNRHQGSDQKGNREPNQNRDKSLKNLSDLDRKNHDPKTKVQDIGEGEKEIETPEMERENTSEDNSLPTKNESDINPHDEVAEENIGEAVNTDKPGSLRKENKPEAQTA